MNSENILHKFESLPIRYQRQLEEYLDFLYAKFRNNLSHNRKSDFNPEEYRGVLSHLDIDLEKELSEMRNQWKHYI